MRAIEYPASRIFVALRNGSLRAQGRQLKGAPTIQEAVDLLDEDGRDLFGLELTDIPNTFWSLQGIEFEASAASNESVHYCHISCLTTEVLSEFPGEREEVRGVRRVGDSFVLDEKNKIARDKPSRGRPSYPWDRFRIEVTALIQSNELPEKKKQRLSIFEVGSSENWVSGRAGRQWAASSSPIMIGS